MSVVSATGYTPWLSCTMKSACCASSTRDHTGWARAITSPGIRAALYARMSGCRAIAVDTSAGIGFAVDAQNAEEKAREYGLNAKGQQHDRRDDLTHCQPRIESPETKGLPCGDCNYGGGQADRKHQRAQRETCLQPDVAKHRRVGGVGRVKPLAHSEHLGEHSENNELVSDQAAKSGEQEGVNVEAKRPDLLRPGLEQRAHHKPQANQRETRIEEQPARAEQEHEAKVPPAIAPCT